MGTESLILGEGCSVAIVVLAIFSVMGGSAQPERSTRGTRHRRIAIALPRKTLENLFGGVSILATKSSIGHRRFGDRVGTVATSVCAHRIRLLNGLLSIPRISATMNVENLMA
jgi:hypothetical protein